MTEQHNLATYEGLKEAFLEQKQRAEATEERCKRLMAPVSDEEYENDRNYTAWVCFSNGGIHIADSDTNKALKVWRRSGIDALLAERGKGKP